MPSARWLEAAVCLRLRAFVVMAHAVRQKAKQLVELLGDNDRIREERQKARKLRNKFVGISNTGARHSTPSAGTPTPADCV